MPTYSELQALQAHMAKRTIGKNEDVPSTDAQCERYMRRQDLIPMFDDVVQRLEVLEQIVAGKLEINWSWCYLDITIRNLIYANLDKIAPDKDGILRFVQQHQREINWRLENFIDVEDIKEFDLTKKLHHDSWPVFYCLPIALLFPNQLLCIRMDYECENVEMLRDRLLKLSENDAILQPAKKITHGNLLLLKPLDENGRWARVLVLAYTGPEGNESSEWLVTHVDPKNVGLELTMKVDRARLFEMTNELSLDEFPTGLYSAPLRGLGSIRFGMTSYVRAILHHYITKRHHENEHMCLTLICPSGPELRNATIDVMIAVDEDNAYLLSEFLIKYGDFKLHPPIFTFDSWHPYFLAYGSSLPARPDLRDLMVCAKNAGWTFLLPKKKETEFCDEKTCTNVDCFMLGRHNGKGVLPKTAW